ncbi:hypothetical protein AMATHDRAFT_51751 [Amanita thiersii Skay4041]|uniref:Uncharacterized protein n=1 Tax=Amanita thiersii Skay4041 TaxID=703135 RepID=A0A2A9NC05_9AGAR|nr:hypothetical protein AMATHDRAFT_51751 [Amanita thiersii Skay4041]
MPGDLVIIPQFFPKGIYRIQSSSAPDCCLTRNGVISRKDDSDEAQHWAVTPVQQGGKLVYEIKHRHTSDPLRVKLDPTCGITSNFVGWVIDTQFGDFTIGAANDSDGRVLTLVANKNRAVLWPINGRKEQCWIMFVTAEPAWVGAHAAIDTSKRYYIKNRATGRYWAYAGSVGYGHVISDHVFHSDRSWYHWILSVNPKDNGMRIATGHGSRPNVLRTFKAIASNIATSPPLVVTAREISKQTEIEDLTKPATTVPLAMGNQYLMFQLLDTGTKIQPDPLPIPDSKPPGDAKIEVPTGKSV